MGFGLGLRSVNQKCTCNTGSNRKDNETARINNTVFNVTKNSNVDENSSSDSESGKSSTLPPATMLESSTPIVPPIINITEAASAAAYAPTLCNASDDALHELRVAVRTYATSFINEYAYFIRQGGNHSEFMLRDDGYSVHDLVAWQTMGTSTSIPNVATNNDGDDDDTIPAMPTGQSRRRRRRRRLRNRPVRRPSIVPLTESRMSNSNDYSYTTSTTTSRRMLSNDDSTSAARPSTGNTVPPSTVTAGTDTVQHTDLVQTDGKHVYIVAGGDHGNEIWRIQSSTGAVDHRMAIPKPHRTETNIAGLLVFTVPDDDRTDRSTQTILVVLVNEYDYVDDVHIDQYGITATNTTVLVYHDLTLVSRYSLPGTYSHAYGIMPNQQQPYIHVVTVNHLDWHPIQDYLTPAYLQTNGTWRTTTSSRNAPSPPKLLLNETEYRQLALAQLERQVDGFVNDLVAQSNLDCTGFVPLLNHSSRIGTNMVKKEPHTLVHLSIIDVSSLVRQHGPSSSSSTSSSSIVSFLPPMPSLESFWNWFVTRDGRRLVLACDVWSGDDFTPASQPMTWLLTFQTVNASLASTLATAGLVSGHTGNYPSHSVLHEFTANGKDYLRVMTTSYDNLADFYEHDRTDYDESDDAAWAARLDHPNLWVLELTTGTEDDSTLPVVGNLSLASLIENQNGTLVSTIHKGNFVLLVVQREAAYEEAEPDAAAAAASSTSRTRITHVVYTIDTTDPSAPRIAHDEEQQSPLVLPASILHLHAIDNNPDWLIGIGSANIADNDDVTTQEPFQLFLLNVSDLAQSPPRLVHQWHDDDLPVSFTGSSDDSTATEVIRAVFDDE